MLWTWGGGEEGEMYGESNMETYIAICKMDSQGNLLYVSGNSNRGSCINLEGWYGEGDRREVQKRRDIYIPMSDLY